MDRGHYPQDYHLEMQNLKIPATLFATLQLPYSCASNSYLLTCFLARTCLCRLTRKNIPPQPIGWQLCALAYVVVWWRWHRASGGGGSATPSGGGGSGATRHIRHPTIHPASVNGSAALGFHRRRRRCVQLPSMAPRPTPPSAASDILRLRFLVDAGAEADPVYPRILPL